MFQINNLERKDKNQKPLDEETKKVLDSPQAQSFFDNLSKSFFQENYQRKQRFFVDLDALIDFNIGALISLMATEEEYAYFLEKLKDYEMGFDQLVAKYFPVLGFTEEQIQERKKDPRFAELLSIISPMNSFYLQFFELIRMTLTENDRLEGPELPIYITFDSRSVRYSEQAASRIVNALTAKFGERVRLEFEIGTLESMSKDRVGMYDVFIIHDIKTLVNDPLSSKWFDEDVFMDKTVFAEPQIDPELFKDDNDPKLISEALTNTASLLNVYTVFEFVPRVVLLDT